MPDPDPWVGTWRPHRPRGPIAAHYKSPGPKYAMPALIGAVQSDPTKYKAPAYSLGVRHPDFIPKGSPGPAYVFPINVTRVGRDGTPAYSIHGRPRDSQGFKGPSPAQYYPDRAQKSVFYTAPAYTLSARSKDFKTGQTPGPASYSLPPVLGPNTVTTPALPASTMCGRSKTGSFHEDLKKTPGPAAYSVVDSSVYKDRPPQHSMAGRNFGPGESSSKPGPAAYHPEHVGFTKAKAPSYTFGIRHSDYTTEFLVKTED